MIKLYKGDCLEVMRKLIAQGVKVDAVICDPPYGITSETWDNPLDYTLMWEQLKELRKSPTSNIVLFGNEPFTTDLINSNVAEFKYRMVWLKGNTTGATFAKYQPLRRYEDILVFYSLDISNALAEYHASIKVHFEGLGYKKADIAKALGYVQVRNMFKESTNTKPTANVPRILEDKYKILREFLPDFEWLPYKEYLNLGGSGPTYSPKKSGKFRTNVLEFNKAKESLHPTQKPIKLMLELIEMYTKPGDIVLDFTMGSGSTGVAAVLMGRSFIGIEQDTTYFKTSSQRIAKAVKLRRSKHG